jgi:hypothetical protein
LCAGADALDADCAVLNRQIAGRPSAISRLPSSASIIAATEVTGLVIEATRKIASSPIGAFFSRSRQPKASAYPICPPRAITSTAPGISPRSTSSRNAAETRSSRPEDNPTCFGRLTFGNPKSTMILAPCSPPAVHCG